MGESTRDNWHQAEAQGEAKAAHLDLPRPEWLFAFDAEWHAYDVYADVSRKIELEGYEFPTLP